MRIEGAVVGFGFEVGAVGVEDDFVEFEFVGGAVGFAREAAGAGVALREFFPGDQPPASTWLGVASLAVPEFLIEIEAIAVLDAV